MAKKQRKRPNWKQGHFPKESAKYFGTLPIVYRSSWEYKLMVQLELNPAVKAWSSEQIVIPYTMMERQPDGKFKEVRHNYHTDFTVILQNDKRYILEVKPDNQSPKSIADIKRDPVMYRNYRKWAAALKWCNANGYEFRVLTENHLKTRIF